MIPVTPAPFEVEDVSVIDAVRHEVFVLHGILSISDWWDDFSHVTDGKFADIEFGYVPVSYALMTPLDLVAGLGSKKRSTLTEARVQDAFDASDADSYSIICHSNGTKVFASLSDDIKGKFDWVFFSGSICHHDDDRKLKNCAANLVNDCGVCDLWPIMLASIRPRTFGHTGVVGFGNSPITDRYFLLNHFGATKRPHFAEWILPVLRGGPVMGARVHKPPRVILFLPTLLRFGALAILIAVLLI
ncbi:MAG: hypothetical protein GVY31_09080 [Alphaproteobacteria bacterium]|jgi:hypothetical protein|nr:hypothetical protein [Alphaproteobacteria bacterium]